MKNIPEDDFNEQDFFKPVPPTAATSGNPLAQYFRMPGLHVTLPSRGMFLPEQYYDETLAGDIPVYPMKAADELLLKSPDALMSGYALEKLVESCVPDIRAPRLISTPDLDVILLAIRAATYGEIMEIEVHCPKCGNDNAFDCNLPAIMDTVTFLDPVNEVRLSKDILVNLRPYNMGSATRAAISGFNEARRISNIEDDSDERRLAINESYERMSKVNIDGIVDCIINIVAPNGTVTDREQIAEFINNTGQPWVKKIENKLIEMNNHGIDKTVDATCIKCSHEWKAEIEFDPSNFFG